MTQRYRSKKPAADSKKAPCKRCIRARWLMTFLMLASMSLILYLNEFAA